MPNTDLIVRILGNTEGLKKSLDEANSTVSRFSGVIKKIGGTIAATFAVKEVISFAKEAAALAGQAEGVTQAFNALGDSRQRIKDLTEATRGTVSELNLMKAAVKADNFKVPLTKLSSFFEFATKRAAQTGESVDYLVESIINGIGRKSSMVLDNLGISASELQEEIKKVGDFGLAAGNIIDRSLSKMGDVTETASQKTARWAATWENLKASFGGFVNNVLNRVAPLIDKLTGSLNNQVDKIKDERVELNVLVGSITASNTSNEVRKRLLTELNSKYPTFLKNIDKENVSNTELVGRLEDVNRQFFRKIALASAQERLVEFQNKVNDSIDDEIRLREKLENQKERLRKATGQIDGSGQSLTAVQGIREEIAQTEGFINAELQKRVGIQEEVTDRISKYTSALGVFNKSNNDYFQSTQKSVDATEKLSSSFQKLTLLKGINTGDLTKSINTSNQVAQIFNLNESMESYANTLEKVKVKTQELTAINDGFFTRFAEAPKEVFLNAKALFDDFSNNVLVGMAEDLGNAVSGIGNFGENVLKAVSGFMKKLGTQMIALGVAKVALDKISASLPGGVLIAAGVGLVAASTVLSNTLNKGVGGGGGSSGFQSSQQYGQTSGLNQFATETLNINLTGKISGQDLLFVQEKANRNRGIRG